MLDFVPPLRCHISKSLCAVERCGALYNAYSPTARSMLDSSSQLQVCCGALHSSSQQLTALVVVHRFILLVLFFAAHGC
ncbi:hypothetical protein PAXRUDRAFT_567609 [Paxillus rubicundulus Ve08.2h10]|uniref:Uncharacterized protein n=1 Tax=Paxillus rubicundulus Ve08.2h10 TaxID=930991 RepID=A0A0D0DUB8_9AGAM|nr:hypothetical protein PAXRUDRAFT_567609 [Paxillus rubicundulus Ve08.2h10]